MMRRRPVLRTVARTAVIAGTATAVAGGVSRHQTGQGAAGPGRRPAAAAGRPTRAARHRPPGHLRLSSSSRSWPPQDQGILTDDEFAAQKAKLLG